MVCTDDVTTGSPVCVPDSSIQKICRDEIRCIAVGDAHSGKNQLLSACEKIDSDKEPLVFFEYSTCKLYNDINHTVVFKGFSGQENTHNLRRLSYIQPTGVFLVCFSVVDRQQFVNATDNWIREIKNFAPESPYLLIGTHTDLRKDPDYRQRLKLECKTVITRKEAKRKAFIHNCKYLECSSTTLEGVKRVFNAAIEAALRGDYAEALRRSVCQTM